MACDARRAIEPRLSNMRGTRSTIPISQIRIARACLALVLACATVGAADAQQNPVVHDVKVMPGRDTRVGVYTSIRSDCTSGPLPAIRLAAPPSHGAVTVKRAMLKATNVKQCLAIDVPAFVAFYRAAADFSGNDSFQLEISFSSGRKEIQLFRVTVAPAGGQRI